MVNQIESIGNPAEKHLVIAEEVFKDAEEDYNKYLDREYKYIPHENPEFRDPMMGAQDKAVKALNSLQLANDFGVPEEETKILKKDISELIKKISDARLG